MTERILVRLPLAIPLQSATTIKGYSQTFRTGGAPVPGKSSTPELSVLIPWISGRGKAIRALESWTRAQTCPPEVYEVIIATSGDGSVIRSSLQGFEDDFSIRVLPESGRTYAEQINACARQALGDWVLVTELHVEARPDCLSRVLAWIQNDSEGFAGAPVETVSKFHGLAGSMESALYEAASRGWNHPEHWHNVRVRGTVIKRSFFLERGGFNPRYELACDIAFGLEASNDGYRFGRITPVCAEHWENINLRGVFGDAYNYSKGEAAFRLEGPSGLAERYLGPSLVFRKNPASRAGWRYVRLQLAVYFCWNMLRFFLARSMRIRVNRFRMAFFCVMELGRSATLMDNGTHAITVNGSVERPWPKA